MLQSLGERAKARLVGERMSASGDAQLEVAHLGQPAHLGQLWHEHSRLLRREAARLALRVDGGRPLPLADRLVQIGHEGEVGGRSGALLKRGTGARRGEHAEC